MHRVRYTMRDTDLWSPLQACHPPPQHLHVVTNLETLQILWIIEKARDSRKASTSASLNMLKHLTEWIIHNKLWTFLKEMGIPDHPICLLGSLYEGQEATVRTGHGIIDWFQMGKEVH